MRTIKFILVVLLVYNISSCGSKKCDKNISEFFKIHEKTYVYYNQKNRPIIDMHKREKFCKYVIENLKINYDEFFLVEIVARGEINTFIKILIIRCGDNYKYLFYVFEKNVWREKKIPNYYLNKYNYQNLKTGVKEENNNEDVLTMYEP